MIRVCSYCGKVFGEKEPLENKEETHRICPECLLGVMENIKILSTPNLTLWKRNKKGGG